MNKFLLDFKRKWVIYLFIAILLIIFECFAIDMAARVQPEDKVLIFMTCEAHDEKIVDILNEDLPKEIKKVEIGFFSPNETFFAPYFSTFGKDADIVTLTQKFSDMCDCESYFAVLNEEEIVARYGEVEFYCQNGVAYGIKIYDGDTKEGIADEYVDYYKDGEEENTYLFFGRDSIHIGDLFEKSNDDSALVILEKIWQNSK